MYGVKSRFGNVSCIHGRFSLNLKIIILFVFQSKENMARGARRGCVRLQGAVIGIDDEDDSTFTIRVDRKGFHFQGNCMIYSKRMLHLKLRDHRLYPISAYCSVPALLSRLKINTLILSPADIERLH